MKRLHKQDSIYLVTEKDINYFTKVVEENPQYAVLLSKNAGGKIFIRRLTFDIFYYLDKPNDAHILDSYKLLDNPLTGFIFQQLIRSESLRHFKRVYNPDTSLKLLVSILITKKVIYYTNYFSLYEDTDVSSIDAYHLEELNQLNSNQSQLQFNKNYAVQKKVLMTLRTKFTETAQIEAIIKETIETAKKMHNFILYTEVN